MVDVEAAAAAATGEAGASIAAKKDTGDFP
jgi:hypothetical protein